MAKKHTSESSVALDVIDQEQDEQQQVAGEVGGLMKLLSGAAIVKWFADGRAIEKRAKARLMAAKAIVKPTDAASDAVVVRFIQGSTELEKEAEAHHNPVTQLLSKLHKRACAVRARATDPAAESKQIAQGHHNVYAEEERRKAAAETERLRLVAEQKARDDRNAEVARLELEALNREADAPNLSEREQAFVDALVKGASPERAARDAGYKDPFKQGAKMLQTPKIESAIDAARDAARIREQSWAIAQQPLDVQVEEVRPNIEKAGVDRNRHSGEIVDADAFVNACFEKGLGIPRDCLMPNPVKLNEYARSMHELINRWPGVRYKKTTSTV